MAKGDAAGAAKSASGTGVPKQDQYSVMHSIMDSLGNSGANMASSMAPSAPPQFGQYQNDFTPRGTIDFGGGNISPMQTQVPTGGRNQPMTGAPRMGSMYGMTAGASGSMAPSNPQDMIRKTMMNKGTFGQSQ